ncbi:hypothetical protein CKA32_003693 [Geitlerinema sp. FC II]|nr:hypothetical protein CKA32_003693 [Geitlerinema sp. FC II]
MSEFTYSKIFSLSGVGLCLQPEVRCSIALAKPNPPSTVKSREPKKPELTVSLVGRAIGPR